ncbi:cyclic GMP-AMP synthase-like receptor 2 [Mytilus edulis]|uniref:cyclic GMP-AMP synthase-like receptor 2 n=1 Tax=Mytilus edulis TaxID=6550 RepID=UPI0039EE8A1D
MEKMSHSKSESLHFYEYLCQKIGSKKVVSARRLTYICRDLKGQLKDIPQITSGSKGEGVDIKGSDFDIMYIDQNFVVYESEKDDVHDSRTVFVMDYQDTHPCYTHLQLHSKYKVLHYSFKQILQQHRGKILLSSECYKLHKLSLEGDNAKFNRIHGPCLSNITDDYDLACCLKCDQWVSQAQPWIFRQRSMWPSPELISSITSCGVFFVPIGYKGSIHENFQWRMSFSVAEKILIFSFSHTQLLCYALLKVLLKEIVAREEDLEELLCSYFLKTLMFWIAEETETSVWRPDNIIPCFMSCVQRLLYCVEYTTLLHYFIPDNNLFYLRFTNIKNKNKLISILIYSYQTGIHIFSLSETLHDFRKFPCEITRSVCENSSLMKTIIMLQDTYPAEPAIQNINILGMFNTLYHHCKTELSRCILTLLIANAYQRLPLEQQQIVRPNNKQQYKNYKHELSQLLVGVHSDAVSGWLKLASFFYVRKNYLTSLCIINYTLSKCTYESTISKITLKEAIQTQKLKLMILSKTMPSLNVIFAQNSPISPVELKIDVMKHWITFNSIQFAHFLRFLCCYHRGDISSCLNSILQLKGTAFASGPPSYTLFTYAFMSLGISVQMLGNSSLAKFMFSIIAEHDKYNETSAAYRLRQLC